MKRILASLLAVCMVLSMLVVVPFTATAAGANEATVGYKPKAHDVAKGTYPDLATLTSDPVSGQAYEVFNADGLVKLAALINNGGANRNWLTGVTIYQTADIDMSSVQNFVGISTNAGAPFKGNYNGQCYKISNLKHTATNNTAGLFGLVMSPAKIQNVYLDSSCVINAPTTVNRGAGSIVAFLNEGTEIDNCYSAATIVNMSTDNQIGGVVGKTAGTTVVTVTNITFAGTVKSVLHAGGVIGAVTGFLADVKNCENKGDVWAEGSSPTYNAAGGIVGYSSGGFSADNCVNYGFVRGPVGGAILGSNVVANVVNISNCSNYGTLYGAKTGIYGFVTTGGTVNTTNCTNTHVPTTIGYQGYTPDASKSALTNLNTLNAAPTSGEYQINDVAGMQKLASFVNAGNTLDNVTIYLTNDINMSSVATTFVIGGAQYVTETVTVEGKQEQHITKQTFYPFCGTFNGQGYTIRNLTQSSNATTNIQMCYGLFGMIAGDGQILNLRLEGGKLDHKSTNPVKAGATVSLVTGMGSVVGVATDSAKITNVYNSRPVVLPCKSFSGGILGCVVASQSGQPVSVTVNNATNHGDLTTYSIGGHGGIIGGSMAGTFTVSNCVNTGWIIRNNGNSGNYQDGGIIGSMNNSQTTIENCWNLGKISSAKESAGIVGFANGTKLTLNNVINLGEVVGTGEKYGGIIGRTNCNLIEATNCINYADITVSGQRVGGFCGSTEWTASKIILDGFVNYGNITSLNAERAAGVLGYSENILTIQNVKNYGTINGVQSSGLIGCTCANTTITNAANYGAVNGTGGNGGAAIVGQITSVSLDLVNVQNYAKITTARTTADLAWYVSYAGDATPIYTADNASADYSTTTQWLGYQTRVNETDSSKLDLRLVGTVDSLDYYQVGFIVTRTHKTTGEVKTLTKSVYNAYEELYVENGENVTVPAYRGDGAYLFAIAIEGIPADQIDDYTFEVQTYTQATKDAAIQNGEKREAFTVQVIG